MKVVTKSGYDNRLFIQVLSVLLKSNFLAAIVRMDQDVMSVTNKNDFLSYRWEGPFRSERCCLNNIDNTNDTQCTCTNKKNTFFQNGERVITRSDYEVQYIIGEFEESEQKPEVSAARDLRFSRGKDSGIVHIKKTCMLKTMCIWDRSVRVNGSGVFHQNGHLQRCSRRRRIFV